MLMVHRPLKTAKTVYEKEIGGSQPRHHIDKSKQSESAEALFGVNIVLGSWSYSCFDIIVLGQHCVYDWVSFSKKKNNNSKTNSFYHLSLVWHIDRINLDF